MQNLKQLVIKSYPSKTIIDRYNFSSCARYVVINPQSDDEFVEWFNVFVALMGMKKVLFEVVPMRGLHATKLVNRIKELVDSQAESSLDMKSPLRWEMGNGSVLLINIIKDLDQLRGTMADYRFLYNCTFPEKWFAEIDQRTKEQLFIY